MTYCSVLEKAFSLNADILSFFFKTDRNVSLWSELLMTYCSVLQKAFSLNADILS